MGVLADIYVASTEEAVSYDDPSSAENFERVQYKSLTALELSTLWAIIQGVPWGVTMMKEFECMLTIDEGERMIERFPEAFTTHLGRMTEEETKSVASQWAQTEELERFPEDAVNSIVLDLCRLARTAGASGKGLFLWNCV
jgi:hypothetical protein